MGYLFKSSVTSSIELFISTGSSYYLGSCIVNYSPRHLPSLHSSSMIPSFSGLLYPHYLSIRVVDEMP